MIRKVANEGLAPWSSKTRETDFGSAGKGENVKFGDIPDLSGFELNDTVYRKVGELYQEFNDDNSRRNGLITAKEIGERSGYTKEELAEVEVTIVD